jgi:hypothetical protein
MPGTPAESTRRTISRTFEGAGWHERRPGRELLAGLHKMERSPALPG